nr:MAG TPA: hypothetical protein [Caudoviricetes sp.]
MLIVIFLLLEKYFFPENKNFLFLFFFLIDISIIIIFKYYVINLFLYFMKIKGGIFIFSS